MVTVIIQQSLSISVENFYFIRDSYSNYSWAKNNVIDN